MADLVIACYMCGMVWELLVTLHELAHVAAWNVCGSSECVAICSACGSYKTHVAAWNVCGSSACVAICGAYGSYNYKTHVAAWNACDSKHMFQHCMYVGHVLQQEYLWVMGSACCSVKCLAQISACCNMVLLYGKSVSHSTCCNMVLLYGKPVSHSTCCNMVLLYGKSLGH